MNEQIETIRPRLNKIQQFALIGAVVGCAGLVLAAVTDTEQFFRSYLIGYMFVISIPLGSLFLFMLHNLVGGPWGFSIRRMLESAIKTLPLMLILFIPLALGLHSLYEWSHPDVVAADKILQIKSTYLNPTFFDVRAGISFAGWILFSTVLRRMSRRLEVAGAHYVTPRLQNLSGLGIVFFFITVTFAVMDWVMSLEPHWASTIYGVIFIVGQGLATFSFMVAMLVALMGMNAKFAEKLRPVYFHDLGNFMLACTMLWAYVSLSQLIIIWGANLGEEATWYTSRLYSDWRIFPAVLFTFHFFVPFVLLLMRRVKKNPKALRRVALFIIVMRVIELIWQIVPSFHHDHIQISPFDIAAPLGVGGLWLYFFLQQLKGRTTMLPVNTPFLVQHAEHH